MILWSQFFLKKCCWDIAIRESDFSLGVFMVHELALHNAINYFSINSAYSQHFITQTHFNT
jgi:hypothetical protein